MMINMQNGAGDAMRIHAMREANSKVVLENLRARGPGTRSELSEHTSLTPQALGPILAELVSSDLVVEYISTRPGPGRPPMEYCFNPDGSHAALIAFRFADTEIVVTNAAGDLVATRTFRHGADTSAQALVDRSITELQRILDQRDVTLDRLHRVGFAIEGRVDDEHLIVHETPAWKEQSVDLGALARPRLSPTTELLATDGERALASSAVEMIDAEPNELIAVVHLSYDIWLFVVQGGKLVASNTGKTGLLSHMPIAGNDRKCSCGRIGCFSTVIGQTALVELYRELTGRSIPAGIDVLDAIANGDGAAAKAAEIAAQWLGRGIEPWLRMIDPDRIVLTGSFGDSDGLIARRLLEVVRSHLDDSLSAVPLDVIQPNLTKLLVG